MLTRPVPGCCEASVLYDLGTEHTWKDSVRTARTRDDFARMVRNKMRTSRIYVAITNYNQHRERKWLEEFGFKTQEASNLYVHSCSRATFMDWWNKNQLKEVAGKRDTRFHEKLKGDRVRITGYSIGFNTVEGTFDVISSDRDNRFYTIMVPPTGTRFNSTSMPRNIPWRIGKVI